MGGVTAHVPGSARFAGRAREQRAPGYRTWHGTGGMGWCAECLLCGQWESSFPSRDTAAGWGTERHPRWCHVINGCHCRDPHVTAVMAARLGIGPEYPRHLAAVLYAIAGEYRKHRAPVTDCNGTAFPSGRGL